MLNVHMSQLNRDNGHCTYSICHNSLGGKDGEGNSRIDMNQNFEKSTYSKNK